MLVLKISTSLFVIPCIAFLFSCTQESEQPKTEIISAVEYENIIPLPVEIQQSAEDIIWSDIRQIVIDKDNNELRKLAKTILSDFSHTFSSSVELVESSTPEIIEQILIKQLVLNIDTRISGGSEAYKLTLSDQFIQLTGASNTGIFRGIQTLKQLINIHLPNVDKTNYKYMIYTGVIIDHPRMEYRGFMLDVARHFYSVEEVKQIIDYLATYKFNVFHLHLTDDQGWRINIPGWPKLTSIGSHSASGQMDCDNCFYSLEEYESLVRYTDERHITLIPEIDVPGHVRAALASYPDELYCDGDAPEWPFTGMEVKISSLCFSNPQIYTFFENVVSEIAKRTTGSFIHIGGDEIPQWVTFQDFNTFLNNANRILNKYGKRMMGWTDDLGRVSELDVDVLGQHWSVNQSCCQNTLNMAKRGSKIVMSPANKTYLDLKYDKYDVLGQDWAGYNTVQNAYNWNPATIVDGIDEQQVYGVEAPLWGETIKSLADAQYLMFPRILALAEVAWTLQNKRNWQAFSKRLEQQKPRLIQQQINYHSE